MKDTRRQKRAKIKPVLPPGTQVIDLRDDSHDIHAGSTMSCTTTTSPATNMMQATIPIATALPSQSAGPSPSILSPPAECCSGLAMTAVGTVPITSTPPRSPPGHSRPFLIPIPGTPRSSSPPSLSTPRNTIASGPSSSLQILSDAAVLGSASASREQRQANPL